MQIIHEREHITETHYCLAFHWQDDPEAGFSFDCDKNGNLLTLCDAARENYAACSRGEKDGKIIIADGMETREHSYTLPAMGLCDCGTEVYLGGFTNTCDTCGADYNWNGSRLAPREQWGEETGESLDDILRIR
jgi:hypothetical protein